MKLSITINGQRLGDVDALAVRDALSEHLLDLRAELEGRASGVDPERPGAKGRRDLLVRALAAMGVQA